MSLRTSLQRLTRRDPATPSLRERLAAATADFAETKDRAGKAAKVARILMTPPEPKPAPVDRLALINYATWLAQERRLLCQELYPEDGARAGVFIHANVAADAFHFPRDGRSWRDVSPPSSRAAQTLDRLGIDWRVDERERGNFDPAGAPGAPVRTPYGWPALDAALLEALDDLTRLDAAQEAMGNGTSRESDQVPGYAALEAARNGALDRLAETKAESLAGLQAKARALLTEGVLADHETTGHLAQSLARDLTGARQSTIEPLPDPIFAAIEEGRRLYATWAAAIDAPARAGTVDEPSALVAARDAFHGHCADVLLKTVPATARGCAALARFAAGFSAAHGFEIDEDEHGTAHLRVLDLIGRSPLI